MKPAIALALALTSCAPVPAYRPSASLRPLFAGTTTAAIGLALESGGGGEVLVIGAERVPIHTEHVEGLSASICRYPKLAIHLDAASATLGPAGGRIFLFGHCNDRASTAGTLPGPEVIDGERVARAIGTAFGLPAPHVRAARVVYPSGGPHPALLVEDLNELAVREAGDPGAVEIPGESISTSSTRTIDRAALAELHLFEIAINNSDWSVFELRPLMRRLRALPSAPLHNVALLHTSGRTVPIAIDFDLAGITRDPIDPAMSEAHLVHASAGERWLPRWAEMQLQDFRRAHGSAAAPAIARLLGRVEAAERAVEALDVSEAAKVRARAHLAAFAAAVSGRSAAR